jgi:hypothetical protein
MWTCVTTLLVFITTMKRNNSTATAGFMNLMPALVTVQCCSNAAWDTLDLMPTWSSGLDVQLDVFTPSDASDSDHFDALTRQFGSDTCITSFCIQLSKTVCAGATLKKTEVAPDVCTSSDASDSDHFDGFTHQFGSDTYVTSFKSNHPKLCVQMQHQKPHKLHRMSALHRTQIIAINLTV